MKLPRRAPREVYRVYEEHEFIAEAGSELTPARSASARSMGLVGVTALLVGALGIFGGLFTSGRRLQKRELTHPRRGSRVASVIGAHVVNVPAAKPRVRRAASEARRSYDVAGWARALASSRPRRALDRSRYARAAAPPPAGEAGRALPVAVGESGDARPAEFGFER